MNMKQETQDNLKQIKRRFRLMMNGMASQSMREKGLGYSINWGISLPVLKTLAAEYGKDYDLAIELWKENIRECKILATLIMPTADMLPDLACLWISQIPNQEIAEMASFNLFQHIDGAKDLAFKWLASESEIEQMCGYHVLSRLFMRGEQLSDREINELFDQAKTALDGGAVALRHVVANMLQRFSSISGDYAEITKTAFKSYELDIF